ncbi:S8 family peptidase [Arthrobacter sp. AK01]|uniref:S8 family serine peptidase n=1 Tax=Arthrobacter sp. AK01 TaxID=2894084 RepID=UPI001E51AA8F|nr:S8 family serine peptidase [Arthrobacter sp. AK01]MCD4850994.1 S8 family peptidase [Arthrobacter sp. AK01]
MVVIAMAGAVLPALPASADDEPMPSAAPLSKSTVTEADPTDQFIVKFKERAGIQSADRQSAVGEASDTVGVPVQAVRTLATGQEVVRTERKLDAEEASELVTALAADPRVEYAEPDTIMRPFAVAPNDEYYRLQWAHGVGNGGMGVLGAWDVSQGEGSVVAVIDSGILNHSDLNANVLPGFDMISDPATARDGNGRDWNPQDEGDRTSDGQCGAGWSAEDSSWHGTHVAGIIAAVAGNTQGVAGVAPKAKIVPVRALGICGGYTSDIADSIIWAAGGSVAGVPNNTHPADVINLSLGGRAACSTVYQNATDFARSKGASVVVAAGNENIDASLVSPANCTNVLVVGASKRDGNRASYSNFGINLDVTAPGGDMTYNSADGIVSTLNNGTDVATTEDYYLKEGTSMAAPQVAAIAALMYSKLPALTPTDVEQKLKATARPIYNCNCGAGLVDATAALNDVASDASPVVPGTPTISGDAVVGGLLTLSPGVWEPAGKVWTDYKWKRNGVLTNGTGIQYPLGPGDLGATFTVTVTGNKNYQASVAVTTAPTAPVGVGTLSAGVPSISGNAYVGGTLTADPGSWDPAPVQLALQWQRNGEPIQSATAKTYTATEEDSGKALTLKVSGSKQAYHSLSVVSEPTALVVPAEKAVSPEPVVFTDAPFADKDTYAIPDTESTNYFIDGEPVTPGIHSATGRITVTAAAKDGYVLLPGATTLWTERFSAKGPDFVPPSISPFKDVLTTQQFYREMAWMADEGISTGWVEADKSVTYRPLTPINRDAMAAFLYRLAGSPAYTPPTKSPFKDVLTTQQFYKEMAWLADQKISSGWTEGDGSRTYRPLTPINRDAMAAFLYRMAGSPEYSSPYPSPFNDVAYGQQFDMEMAWMLDMEISTGWVEADGKRNYRPLSPINRDAMAAFLYRMP